MSDWFDQLVDQDWAGETETRPQRDRDLGGGRLPPPGQTIDLRDPTDETETAQAETRHKRDQPAPLTETSPRDLDKAAADTDTNTETPETTETETAQARQNAYDTIADALIAAADHLPTTEQAAEARRNLMHSARARAACYNTSAAAAGLLPAAAGAQWTAPGIVTGWLDSIAAEASIGGGLIIGGGLTALIWAIWDRRTRTLPAWAAWTARIPLASAIAGVLLWAPAWPALNL